MITQATPKMRLLVRINLIILINIENDIFTLSSDLIIEQNRISEDLIVFSDCLIILHRTQEQILIEPNEKKKINTKYRKVFILFYFFKYDLKAKVNLLFPSKLYT